MLVFLSFMTLGLHLSVWAASLFSIFFQMCKEWKLRWSSRLGSICLQAVYYASQVSFSYHSIFYQSSILWEATMWGLLLSFPSLFYRLRLPVIQALAAEVRQITQSLLSQLLQKLRSNIQVSCSYLAYGRSIWFILVCRFWSLYVGVKLYFSFLAVTRMSANYWILAANWSLQRVWNAFAGKR